MSQSRETEVDWTEACRQAWDSEAIRVRGVPSPVDAESAFRAAVELCAPFQVGTRPHSVTAVRFFTSAGRLAVPGRLLPNADDVHLAAYFKRLAHDLDGEPWLLTIRHPFAGDYARWALVRDAAAALWSAVGWPALPVDDVLSFGHGYRLPPEPRQSDVSWVLSGTVADVGAGDLFYRPTGDHDAEAYGDQTAMLRLQLPTDTRAVVADVARMARELAKRVPGAESPLPHVPFPPEAEADGRITVMEPFDEAARTVGGVVGNQSFEEAVLRAWAVRRSAAGLEPAPAPAPAPPAGGGVGVDAAVRTVAEIVQVPLSADRRLVAANGHAVTVTGPAAPRLLAALAVPGVVRVTDLCHALGAEDHPEGVLAMLRALIRMRAVEIAALVREEAA